VALVSIFHTSYRPEKPSPVDEPFRPSQSALAARRFYEELMASVRGEPGMPVSEPKPDVNPATHGPRDEAPIREGSRADRLLVRRLKGDL
jgi:hypothetical protein